MKKTSLRGLPQKKITTGVNKLQAAGIDVSRWLAMLNASDAEMQRLASAWPVFQPSYAYDAVSIFGFGPASNEPLPEAEPGEIVIRYGGWSLTEIGIYMVGRELMHEQDWYDRYPWSSEKLPPGTYRLRVPVPDSNRKTFAEQERLLPQGEQVAPVVLVATALLAHRLKADEDLLNTAWTRCKEQTADGYRVVLGWVEGRLYVYGNWGDLRHGDLWVSSLRTS
jgi:hypothetical protein